MHHSRVCEPKHILDLTHGQGLGHEHDIFVESPSTSNFSTLHQFTKLSREANQVFHMVGSLTPEIRHQRR